jgi:lysyl-tRNA synthetase class I
MSDDERKRFEESITDLAADRIEEAADCVTRVDPAKAFGSVQPRRNHAEEFQQQALALLSDASEALENGEERAVRTLLKAAITYIEAIQDLLIGVDAELVADSVAEAIEASRQARSLLTIHLS